MYHRERARFANLPRPSSKCNRNHQLPGIYILMLFNGNNRGLGYTSSYYKTPIQIQVTVQKLCSTVNYSSLLIWIWIKYKIVRKHVQPKIRGKAGYNSIHTTILIMNAITWFSLLSTKEVDKHDDCIQEYVILFPN